MATLDVFTVCPGARLVLLTDNQHLRVTHMYAAGGRLTEDPAEALAVVAGPDASGHWWTVDLSKFTPASVH